jgi:hypothetical protein
VEGPEFGTSLGTAPDGSRFNQVINSDLYWYQQEWSNEGSQCRQRLIPLAPAVTKVTPAKGPASGGTTVTITGTHFIGTTAVRFGSTNATSFTVKSSKSIVAVSPAATVGTIDVTVTTPGGTTAISLADHFKFIPAVTNLNPNAGSKAGGTTVTVTGSGFALGTTATIVRFGAAKATSVNCTSTTSCTVVAPKHEAGTVDVTAIVNKVASLQSPPGDQFTYS